VARTLDFTEIRLFLNVSVFLNFVAKVLKSLDFTGFIGYFGGFDIFVG
jgi:hypothetical protein